ncbi:MAG: PD40 domain-containing protein [Ardenticatenia bacterium]|nr:PD40 domain-containing protein [Ardenticatenia bacterium]
MREDDLLRFTWIADPQIAPDGRRVAFTHVAVDAEADEYRTAIWLADLDGDDAPRPLTYGAGDSQPRWSPDGSLLAFVRKVAGQDGKDAQGQIYVLPLVGGEARQVTRLAKGASQPAWSPDGKRLAFLSGTNPAKDEPEPPKPKNVPGRIITRPVWRMNGAGFLDWEHLDQIWVQDLDGETARQLTTGDHAAGAPRWSSDGRWILFLADRRAEPWYEEPLNALYGVSPELAAPTAGDALSTAVAFQGYLSSFTESTDGRIAGIGSLGGHPRALMTRRICFYWRATGRAANRGC